MLCLRRFAIFSIGAVVLCTLGTQPCLSQWDVSQASSPTKQYVDPEGTFTFDAPAKWQIETKADSTVFRWNAAAVTLFRRSMSTDLPQLTSDVIDRIKSVASGFQQGTTSNPSIASTPASSVEFTAKGPNGEASRGRVVAIADSTVGLAILLTAPLADFGAANAQLDKVLSTLAFSSAGSPKVVKLAERTRIKVAILEGLSSSNAKKNEEVRYEVVEDVLGPNREILVAKGAMALGTVTRASHRGIFGKPGKLNISIDFVRAVDDTKVPLRANEDMSKRGKNNSTGAAAATILVAPLGLLINGRDVSIKKGTEFVIYVSADTQVDIAKAKSPTTPSPQ